MERDKFGTSDFYGGNIFVHGNFKKLRDEKREFKKTFSNFEKKFEEYQQRESDFKNANCENSAERIQEQYYLTKEKIIWETARQSLQNTKNFLEGESEKLVKRKRHDKKFKS